MKYNHLFEQYLSCSSASEVFQYFKQNLQDSITLWDYFVKWEKVLNNFKTIEIHLNTLNYLIGKENIEQEFGILLKKMPDIISTIPILLALRTDSKKTNVKVLTDYTNNNFTYKVFDFKSKPALSQQEIDSIIEFTKNTGILELFKNKTIKSIPDYVIGVEVGLDTNGRKNRIGICMENIVENFLAPICQQNNFRFISQATAKKIKEQWEIDVNVDKSERRFDFAINTGNKLYLIETNFYGGGGSKLKSTAGEYRGLYDFISSQEHRFIWVTDGLGWKKSLLPLEETFNYIDYTMNIKMVASGLFGEIIKQNL
ncbi:MAG: type II restriction endonuclease [Cyanobacteria bacterium P01_D01_bin.116]